MKCTLSKDINTCPFCDKENMKCKNVNSCSFQEKTEVQDERQYNRKERWYEKYYKDSKPIK